MASQERQRSSREGQGKGNLVNVGPLEYMFKGNARVEKDEKIFVGAYPGQRFGKGDAREGLGPQRKSSIYPRGGFKEGQFQGDTIGRSPERNFPPKKASGSKKG